MPGRTKITFAQMRDSVRGTGPGHRSVTGLIQIKTRFPDCPVDATGHICRWPLGHGLVCELPLQGGAVLPKETSYILLLLCDGPQQLHCRVADTARPSSSREPPLGARRS